MKARLKETGIIIELDEYCYDLDGNEYKWDELDLMIEPDWSSFRREAAKDILAGLAASGRGVNLYADPVFAVKLADELIKQLKEQ